MVRKIARAGLWIAVLLAMPRSPAPAQEAVIEEARVRLRTVRLRIEPTWEAPAGACLGLDKDALQVTLRGTPLAPQQIVELQRETLRKAQALLLDTSGSMVGRLGFIREAASGFVEQLRPNERAMVATFDDSLVLAHPLSPDRDSLLDAISTLRIGGATALLDALHHTIREIASHDARPVVLLLTDGVDSSSFFERGDVMTLARRLPDLTIFTIGLGLPEIGRSSGPLTPKKFLQRLAYRTNGRYFDVGRGSRLDDVFARIREMLDNEARLTVIDPDPDADPGKLKVRSLDRNCRVRLFRELEALDPRAESLPIAFPRSGLPRVVAAPSEARYRKQFFANVLNVRRGECEITGAVVDPEIAKDGWWLQAHSDRIDGCRLDVTLDYGTLYGADTTTMQRTSFWIELFTRPLAVPLPAPHELPRGPEEWMDTLASHAVSVAGAELITDPFQVPAEWYARSYQDHPSLSHGGTLLDLRPHLARATGAVPAYDRWVRERLRRESSARLADLVERWRRIVPERTDAELFEAVRQSAEGRAILGRAETPSALDLQRHLAAWLGDISAHELFVRWEIARANRWLAEPHRATPDSFFEQWRELRRVFYVPSYARVLGLLTPVHDRQRDLIGYWRVVLPRSAWLLPRVKNRTHDHSPALEGGSAEGAGEGDEQQRSEHQ